MFSNSFQDSVLVLDFWYFDYYVVWNTPIVCFMLLVFGLAYLFAFSLIMSIGVLHASFISKLNSPSMSGELSAVTCTSRLFP